MAWIWHTSSEISDQSKYPSIVGASMALTAIMVIVVLTRLYVRWQIVQSPGKDDYVTFASAAVSIIYNSLAVWQTRMGLGLRPDARPEEEAHRYHIINFASRPLYMLVVTGYKVPLCLAYLRVLNGTQSIYRKITWGLLAFIVVSHGVSTLIIIFQCRPVQKSWQPDMERGTCLEDFPIWISTASMAILCDVLTFVLPVSLFFSLQISLRRKTVLSVLFVLGFFTTVCSAMRMVQIWEIARTGDNSSLVLWAIAEMNVGIALSCAAALKPLFDKFTCSKSTVLPGYETSGRLHTKRSNSVQLQNLPQHLERTESEEEILPMQ